MVQAEARQAWDGITVRRVIMATVATVSSSLSSIIYVRVSMSIMVSSRL